MSGDSIQKRLFQRFDSEPEGRALAFLDESGEYKWRSFGSLYKETMVRAAALADNGVSRGDVCILIPENDAFSTTSLLAVLILVQNPFAVHHQLFVDIIQT